MYEKKLKCDDSRLAFTPSNVQLRELDYEKKIKDLKKKIEDLEKVNSSLLDNPEILKQANEKSFQL